MFSSSADAAWASSEFGFSDAFFAAWDRVSTRDIAAIEEEFEAVLASSEFGFSDAFFEARDRVITGGIAAIEAELKAVLASSDFGFPDAFFEGRDRVITGDIAAIEAEFAAASLSSPFPRFDEEPLLPLFSSGSSSCPVLSVGRMSVTSTSSILLRFTEDLSIPGRCLQTSSSSSRGRFDACTQKSGVA
jgi:ethanolamine utilization microcompartment shell protein EutS